jgi:hypothetical protein
MPALIEDFEVLLNSVLTIKAKIKRAKDKQGKS